MDLEWIETSRTERGVFLGVIKLVNQVSLNGHCGRKIENQQTIYTYLNSGKAVDSSYTDF